MNNVAPLKILKASAGSGKTFSLTLHYLTLLLKNDNNYREILAVTFTNKATGEMKNRILSVLHGLALGDNCSSTNSFRELLILQNPTWNTAGIQQKAHHIYRRILHDYFHFTISTIDGFSQKVIRSFTYELHLDSSYKIEMNTNKVKEDLSTMLYQLLDERPDLLEWIIEFAERKINNNENWNYRQELNRLASLIFTENYQEFDAALKTDSSRKVFDNLSTDIYKETQTYLDVLGENIESFQKIYIDLQIQPDELKGKSRNRLVSASKTTTRVNKLTTTELDACLNRFLSLIDNEDAFTDNNKNVRYDYIQAFNPVLTKFEELKKLLPAYIGYQAIQSNLYYLRLLNEMSNLLSKWRQENSAQLLSDSQILLSKLGLDNNSDPTFIWEKIGNKYNYFLFDEFQDTSRLQWKNYGPLLLNAMAHGPNQQHAHLIVGDVKQSIYRWRNGDWRILLQQVEDQVVQTFHLDSSNIHSMIENSFLETNFRSLPNIIRFNNYIYEHIPRHLQEILNKKIDSELSDEGQRWWAKEENNDLLVRAYKNSAQNIPSAKINDASKQGSIEIEFLPVESGRYRSNQVVEQALERVCEKIQDWITSGRYKAKQIGILVRNNKQAVLLIEKLMSFKSRTGVPFDVISGDALSLASNEAIQLLIETLRSMIHTSDKHVLQHARMAHLYKKAHNEPSFKQEHWLDFKANNIQVLKAVLPESLIEEWTVWQRLPLVLLAEKLIEVYGFNSYENIHIPYLLAFKDLVQSFTSNGDRGISQFLEFWEQDGNKATLPNNGNVDAIEVSTIHKSKGLAYDVVMLPFCSWELDGMTNGDFWISTVNSPFEELVRVPIKYVGILGKSIFYKQYYEEMLFNYMDSLNTLYVASTRAIEHLYITAPSFKKVIDKKTGETKGLDIKNDLISDVLFQVLDRNQSPFRITDGQYTYDQVILKDDLEDKQPTKTSNVSIHQYPISRILEKEIELPNRRDINLILMLDKAAQYGILAHEVIAEASTEADIASIINQYIEKGILAEENKNILLTEIYRIWNHPKIHTWLNSNYEIRNEASIITKDGKTLRPDKIFINKDETIVLDFKFTEDNYIEHKEQVDTYRNTLKDLGYSKVKGYLYYAKINELIEVQ